MRCIINSIRSSNKLKEISNTDLTSMTCIKWKTDNNGDLYCWKDNVSICDVSHCNYPAINKYTKLEDFINRVQNKFFELTIDMPIEILNIIINYAYKIHPQKNGLCLNHNKKYDISIGWIFESEYECNTCFTFINRYNPRMINKLRHHDNYFYGNITLHHISHGICDPRMYIDHTSYFNGGCVQLCKQLNTWCGICKKCIGHTGNVNDIYTHNILKYPHCILCGVHSQYVHCNKCGEHSKYKNYDICDNHEQYPYCNICHNHKKYPHCEICNSHEKYPHCEICNSHEKYPHCENCWNLGYNNVHHDIIKKCEEKNRASWK
jgi:hypothetical protein